MVPRWAAALAALLVLTAVALFVDVPWVWAPLNAAERGDTLHLRSVEVVQHGGDAFGAGDPSPADSEAASASVTLAASAFVRASASGTVAASASGVVATSASASVAASASGVVAASASATVAASASASASASVAASTSASVATSTRTSAGTAAPVGAVARALERQRRSSATFEPLPVEPSAGALAPAELPFLDACVDSLQFHVEDDTRCYEQMAARTTQALARDPHAPYCWGYSGRAPTGEPLLFHTLVLNGVGSQTPLLLWSFLATQCCDAVLWFWLAPQAARNMSATGPPIALPPELAHRVVFKPFDAAAEWAPVAADFPAANETALAALNGFTDIRYVSDWARQLLMYRYGGLWADIDTVFLQDARPLFAFTPFAYRAGNGLLLNNALLRLGKAPNPVTREIMAAAIAAVDPRPDHIFYTIGYARAAQPEHLHYLRQTLFDFMWLRFAHSESEGLKRIHPEVGVDRETRHWDGFFAPTGSDEELQRRRSTAFLPGSYTYHWHNRYERGLPERAWAGVLAARFEELARAKARVCELLSRHVS